MGAPFSIDVKRLKDKVSIIAAGDLIINHIEKIKEQIVSSIDFSSPLHLHIVNPSSMDITFIQLIIALRKTYENKGLTFNLDANLNEEVYSLAANAGFQDLF